MIGHSPRLRTRKGRPPIQAGQDDGSGISTLMADAGLTNGAFYAHFASKDDLVTNVVADELRTQVERYDTLRPGRQGLEDFVRGYLSPEHRDQPGTGCPSAAP